MSNRHVPIITGTVAIAAGVGMALWSMWLVIPGALLLWFGWASLKTGLFASDQEISELTADAPMSDATAQKFEERL